MPLQHLRLSKRAVYPCCAVQLLWASNSHILPACLACLPAFLCPACCLPAPCLPAASLSERFYALRRSAVSSLVAIASHSRRNQISLLTNHADSYSRLMRDVLAGCGDADTQVRVCAGGGGGCRSDGRVWFQGARRA